LIANASTNGVVTFSVAADEANTAEVTLSGANNETVTIVKAGTVKIKANVLATDNQNAAEKIITLTIQKADQRISFEGVEDVMNSAEPFAITASASSGLSVTFGVVSGPATIANNTVTLTGEIGEVVIEAVQPGNENYNAATAVTQSFMVDEDPILSIDNPADAVIQMWPMPAKDVINITSGLHKIETLVIWDAFGRTIIVEKPNVNSHQVNIKSYSDGIYTLKVQTKKGTVIKHVVIVR
jgi:hypothetical protein